MADLEANFDLIMKGGKVYKNTLSLSIGTSPTVIYGRC